MDIENGDVGWVVYAKMGNMMNGIMLVNWEWHDTHTNSLLTVDEYDALHNTQMGVDDVS